MSDEQLISDAMDHILESVLSSDDNSDVTFTVAGNIYISYRHPTGNFKEKEIWIGFSRGDWWIPRIELSITLYTQHPGLIKSTLRTGSTVSELRHIGYSKLKLYKKLKNMRTAIQAAYCEKRQATNRKAFLKDLKKIYPDFGDKILLGDSND